jgi:hypothetical protein
LTISVPDKNVVISSAYLFLLATVFPVVTIDGKNFLFIAFAILGTCALTVLHYRSFPRKFEFLPLVILAFIVLSSFIGYRETQWISTLYSIFFVLSYFFYSAFIKTDFLKSDYRRILEFIFVLFFFGLVAGQLTVSVVGFVPVSVSGSVVHGWMGVMLEGGQFRYHSFASEPSYAAFIVITLYYSIVRLHGDQSLFRGRNLVYFLMLLYMLFFFRSAYAALLLGLLLVNYLGFNKRSLIIYFLIFSLGLGILSFINQVPGAARIVYIASNFDIANPHYLAVIDFNAYYRIAPFLHYLRIFDWQNVDFWVGHGAAAARHLVIPETFLASQGEFLGGFIPSFFYDYGIIGAALVIVFILRLLPGVISVPSAIVLLMLLNANFNTQLFWFVVMCLALTNYFTRSQTPPAHESIR